jgi:hypothetical protein
MPSHARLFLQAKPDAAPRCAAFARNVLRAFTTGLQNADEAVSSALAAAYELADTAARRAWGEAFNADLTYDGQHVMISVGDIHPIDNCENEPGLFLVKRVADDVGEHSGEYGGSIIWASIPVDV